MFRYAVKFLFQFRRVSDGIPNKRRICEERIVIIESDSPERAYQKAKEYGRRKEFKDIHGDLTVCFECIGILEMIELGLECDDNEVWWQLSEKMFPMERRNKIIPPKEELAVFEGRPRARKIQYI